MSGSVFFFVIVGVLAIGVVVLGVPFLLIPIVVIVLGALAVGPVLTALRGSSISQPDSGPSTPSTRDASYDPTSEPR